MSKKPDRTTTSAFGISGRQSHDSSPFYAGRLYQDQPQENLTGYVENPLPENCMDRILCRSSEEMSELPDSSFTWW
jgi:site-specific DNA-methyltransferase (adenine-specific)